MIALNSSFHLLLCIFRKTPRELHILQSPMTDGSQSRPPQFSTSAIAILASHLYYISESQTLRPLRSLFTDWTCQWATGQAIFYGVSLLPYSVIKGELGGGFPTTQYDPNFICNFCFAFVRLCFLKYFAYMFVFVCIYKISESIHWDVNYGYFPE